MIMAFLFWKRHLQRYFLRYGFIGMSGSDLGKVSRTLTGFRFIGRVPENLIR